MDGRYTRVAIWLHWLIALGIIANVAIIWFLDGRPAINTHKSIGITVLALAILRLLWRVGHRPPPFPASYQAWERTTAHIVHWGLYFVIFAMPITGWVMDSAWDRAAANPNYWFGLFQWPRLGFVMDLPPERKLWVHDTFGAAHGLIAYLVYALVALHLAGALKHQFQGHREMRRMGIGR